MGSYQSRSWSSSVATTASAAASSASAAVTAAAAAATAPAAPGSSTCTAATLATGTASAVSRTRPGGSSEPVVVDHDQPRPAGPAPPRPGGAAGRRSRAPRAAAATPGRLGQRGQLELLLVGRSVGHHPAPQRRGDGVAVGGRRPGAAGGQHHEVGGGGGGVHRASGGPAHLVVTGALQRLGRGPQRRLDDGGAPGRVHQVGADGLQVLAAGSDQSDRVPPERTLPASLTIRRVTVRRNDRSTRAPIDAGAS